METLSDISIILPSLDPDEKLLGVVRDLLETGFSDIILINDGSKPENLHYFETLAQDPRVHLLHHPCNMGKGAALKTGFRYFLDNRPQGKGVVTVDGDGQHHCQDTAACALHMLDTGRITLGVRDFSQPDVPERSRKGNRITVGVFRLLVGMKISDTQTGLRAFPRELLEEMCQISGDRFEYETNMLLEMKRNGWQHEEVKIRTVYIEENKSSHFRAVRDSWRIYKLILAHFFKYTLASALSAVMDEGIFLLMTALLGSKMTGLALTIVPTFTARLISSLFNFAVNRRLVFRSRETLGRSLLKYYLLALPVAVLQSLLTYGLTALFQLPETAVAMRAVIYGIVMLALFCATFLAQQHWVFVKKKEGNENHD